MSKFYAEVIGDPIVQSKSPLIHNFWIEKLGLDAEYRACHVTTEALPDYIASRRSDPDWRGCNVTMPHKLAVMDLVEDRGDVRGSIGAMNTLVRDGDGIWGTNTDAAGFAAPLAELDLSGVPVAVIGSGGAARAVLFALAQLGAGPVTMICRNPLAGGALLARFGLKGATQPIDVPPSPVGLLVNASPLGMKGQEPLNINLSSLTVGAIVYDIVYSPIETALLHQAEERGLATIDGLEMLVGQAAVAFELFFGVAPPRNDDAELRALLLA